MFKRLPTCIHLILALIIAFPWVAFTPKATAAAPQGYGHESARAGIHFAADSKANSRDGLVKAETLEAPADWAILSTAEDLNTLSPGYSITENRAGSCLSTGIELDNALAREARLEPDIPAVLVGRLSSAPKHDLAKRASDIKRVTRPGGGLGVSKSTVDQEERLVLPPMAPDAESILDLSPGWNLISLPLLPTTPYTAQSLLDEINGQGGTCTEIDRWLNGGWDPHIDGLPFNNYAVELGAGYFLRCTGASAWMLLGEELGAQVPLQMAPGWNLVGVPYPLGTYAAQSYLDKLNGWGHACPEIDRWLNGGWDPHIDGLPFNDYALEAEQGYFVRCTLAFNHVDMSIDKADSGEIVFPGGTIRYTLSYSNTGNQVASGVVLTETVPENTSFNAGASAAGWTQVGATDTYTYSVGGMEIESSGVISYGVSVGPILPPLAPLGFVPISNTVQISDDGGWGADPTPGDNEANLITPVYLLPTDVRGTIDSDTTWLAVLRPYVVTCNVNVSSSGSLTVEMAVAEVWPRRWQVGN